MLPLFCQKPCHLSKQFSTDYLLNSTITVPSRRYHSAIVYIATDGVPYTDPYTLCMYDWELAIVYIPQQDLAEFLAFTLAIGVNPSAHLAGIVTTLALSTPRSSKCLYRCFSNQESDLGLASFPGSPC